MPAPPGAPAPTPRHVLARMAVFGGVALWLQATPIAVQVLGGPVLPFGESWSMYSGVGRDLCSVGWGDANHPGLRIDRREVLGLGHGADDDGRFLRSPDAIRAAGQALCAALPDADVRADGWCPAPDGRWVLAVDPSEVLCH